MKKQVNPDTTTTPTYISEATDLPTVDSSVHSTYTPEPSHTSSIPTYILPSMVALQKYGISKSLALNMLQTQWQIKAKFSQIFKTYYLLHWERAYFDSQLKEGTITRLGVTYQVIYHSRAHSTKQGTAIISFRELQPEYAIYPVALVIL